MSKSTHQFEVKGVDKSAGAFGSIKNRAAATSAQIRSMVGGALGALGAYFTFSSIKGGIDELGRLSDVAQKTSTSVGELTQTTSALKALGIQNMGVDQLGKAFDYMAKTTGRSGMEGFYKTIEELGQIPDVAQRSQAAMQIFGRSGMEFMPLINAAKQGTQALRACVAAMPGLSKAAAEAGDAASGAMGFAANEIQHIWMEGLGFIANKLNNDYTGDVRTAALNAGNALEKYTRIAVAKCLTWYQKLQNGLKVWGEAIGTFVGGAYEKLFGSGGTWGDVWKQTTQSFTGALDEYEEEAKKLDEIEAKRIDATNKKYEARAILIKKYADAQGKATQSTRERIEAEEGAAVEDMARQTRISNDLILGGSNAATRLQLLGPTLQSETKKQTAILERIAANTEKTADNTEESSKEEFNTLGS